MTSNGGSVLQHRSSSAQCHTPGNHRISLAEKDSAACAPALNAQALSQLARTFYDSGPLLLRKFQHWRPFICPFERLLPHVPPKSTVLDVGCGCGLFLALLLGAGHEIRGLGLDLSQKTLHLARRMAGRGQELAMAGHVEFRLHDVTQSWPDRQCDVVCLIDVAHHLSRNDLPGLIRQASQRLRPGGKLLYKDLDSRNSWRALANRLHDLCVARQWVEYIPVAEVEQLAADHGLELQHAEDIDRLWYSHQLRVFRKRDG